MYRYGIPCKYLDYLHSYHKISCQYIDNFQQFTMDDLTDQPSPRHKGEYNGGF